MKGGKTPTDQVQSTRFEGVVRGEKGKGVT